MSLVKRVWHTYTTNKRNVKHAAMFVAPYHDSCQPLVIITTLRYHEGPGWQIDFDFISDSLDGTYGMGRIR